MLIQFVFKSILFFWDFPNNYLKQTILTNEIIIYATTIPCQIILKYTVGSKSLTTSIYFDNFMNFNQQFV